MHGTYAHFHERSSKWFRENFLDYSVGPGAERRDAHHHRIIDRRTGLSGEGFGFSYQESERKAWEDLRKRRGHRSATHA